MTRSRWILLVVATPLGNRAAVGQDRIAAQVDAYVQAEMRQQQIPGLSLAVIQDGKVVRAKGYGFAMMLVEAGKLRLDDPIPQYFPEAPAGWDRITVRHLLSHTAGTTDYPSDFDFRRDYTEAELLERAAAIPLAFEPGERWSYSNVGYLLLGILIHRVSGQFYGDFLRDRIFQPLGMTTARIISEADIVPNRAAGYRLVNGELKNQEWVSPSVNTTADGALYLTVQDMAKWDAALASDRLLKQSSLSEMWSPVRLNSGKTEGYGFGWRLGEVRGHRLVEHGGSWQGFKAHITRYLDDRLTVVVFVNLAQANQGRIAHGIAAIYHPELAPASP